MATTTQKPKILVIVGETGSGKSSLAMKLAKGFNGEIVAADSWTVYNSFDIGTAKPSKAQQKQIKHHLIDVVEAPQGFNAPKFKRLAEAAIRDIQTRGKIPIMVGGTGLYIDSILFDFGFLPNSGPSERQRLNEMTIAELLEVAQSQKIDLKGVDIRNKRRIIRAIEAKGQKPTKSALKKGVLIVGLHVSREELRKRVEQRVEKMLDAGLEQEVNHLADRYGWEAEPMKGIGYREWQAYFQGSQTLRETIERIISATLNLAKRQRTWFKRNPHIQWFSSTQKAYIFISSMLSN